MVNNRSEVRVAPSGCLVRYSATRYQLGFSGRPTRLGRIAAAANVGDQWGCRKTASIPAAIPGKRRRAGQQQSHRARSSLTKHSKLARTAGNQSAIRNLPWLVRRHRVESSAPVSLCAGSHGAGHVPPSLLRAVFFNENRLQRTGRLPRPSHATSSNARPRVQSDASGRI